MKNKFLGHVVKLDREAAGLSQSDLQKRVRNLSIQKNSWLTEDEKNALFQSKNNWVKYNGKFITAPIPSKLISNIERGVARYVIENELELIASALDQDPSKYFELEINPMKLITENKVEYQEEITKSFYRSIEFDPEYRQAGVSILTFFSEVVRSEYSDQDVRVGILQDGNTVTLRVETFDGTVLKEIEQTLEKYGLVVMGTAPIESLSANRELIRDLKTRLELTGLELRLRQENYLEEKKHFECRILTMEDQVKQLHQMIGTNLAQSRQLSEIIKLIIGNDKVSSSLQSALSTIDKLATSQYSDEAVKKLEASIKEIEKASPGLVRRLLTTMETIPAAVLGNLASPWVQSLFTSLPK